MRLPRLVQRRLCDYYGLDDVPDVTAFVEVGPAGSRERVLVRESVDGVELRVELPETALGDGAGLDGACQLVEGVSHFVLLAERIRCELPTTHLELEMQAEVDKFLVLGVLPNPLPDDARAGLRRRLFEEARFLDPEQTDAGERYRLASWAAERFVHRLERDFLRRARHRELRALLARFFRAGQTEKLSLARAA
ncbi:MAG: hypothetical protein FJ095_18945 [Deltaproteobacteria bacterium]|nr:hypothetical protein [Deltaproteobacteria bacterium]